ncbi:DeoR/GlpR family transcriptional regulator of sugar metabolism [Nonomuraea thailandensis]|uniref:Lactose phosphotransferase system repressor n=1 Tax=Nonomuraea thailandensis TaxID=1188745 RepID=A0A9X2GHJ8_9ACTN|nr:DeoR/GlpR family DNA-binding transcription regulator [Nonomuraea thailandensis]MCP2358712.1 DeoR/GlpR family transcriptional regulator of sugar metabolism [Nonomuraea thailandensis]
MLQRLRHAEIMRRVRASGATSVRDLASQLGVSPSTIRRDLEVLDRDGTLRRVRGGALPCTEGLHADADADRPFAEVAGTDGQDKEAVAARAARLVADGEVVLLDIGTTTMRLARRLRGRRITVVTSSLAVLDVLRSDPEVELLLLGGMVRRPYHSLVGVLTEAALSQVVADRVFLGASGVRPDGQLVDTTLAEVPLKRAMIAAAGQVVLLVDRHKFPGTGALRVCGPEDIDMIVTNDGADEATLRACAAAGAEILLA